MRVLVVKLSSFGDVVHTFPALSDLAAAFPEAEVDWLVEEAFAPLLRLHPAVGAVFTISLRRRRARPLEWPALLAEFRALRRALRARRYDHVVDLQGLPKSAILGQSGRCPGCRL